MNCTWLELESPNEAGRRRVKCECCGFVTAPTPHPPEKIHRKCGCIGLGDNVSEVLAAYGITKERVSRWLGRRCKCPERQAKLNRLGVWARKLLGGEPAEDIHDAVGQQRDDQ